MRARLRRHKNVREPSRKSDYGGTNVHEGGGKAAWREAHTRSHSQQAQSKHSQHTNTSTIGTRRKIVDCHHHAKGDPFSHTCNCEFCGLLLG